MNVNAVAAGWKFQIRVEIGHVKPHVEMRKNNNINFIADMFDPVTAV